MTDAPGAADRWRFALLVACLLLSLALYLALAVILGSVPPGWNSPLGFALPAGQMFRGLTGLPAAALSGPGFQRALTGVLVASWAIWGGAVLALRGMTSPGLRRRAVAIVIVGAVAMLALVVVCVPTTLSADIYRQCAYGRMVAHYGLNPYTTPVNAIPGDPLFALADHTHVTTHYGPTYTLLSALAAALAPSTALGDAVMWKAMSACAALGCAVVAAPVVRALGGGEAEAQDVQLWLAWNPLLIVESAASGHNEAIMMLPALAGIVLWQRGRPVRGLLALVISTLTKWLTGLLVLFAIAREVHRTEPGKKLSSLLRLVGAAGLATALLYAPFARGLIKSGGGIAHMFTHGSDLFGPGVHEGLPQQVLGAAFAVVVLATVRFVARGDWARLVTTTTALLIVFVAFVNPWPYPWHHLTHLALAATLPRGRAGFLLRTMSVGVGATSMLMYTTLVPT